MRPYAFCVLAAALLGGCASVVPEDIRTAAPGKVQVVDVREHPQQYRNAVVRWGGIIVSTRNERDHTIIEIVERDLDQEGRPRPVDRSQGRFLAKVSGFLDPAIYKPEREVTVRGRVEAVVEQSIGEYRYSYPVVLAEDAYLWQPRLAPTRYPYNDPFFYDPWSPWGWPYYRPWPY